MVGVVTVKIADGAKVANRILHKLSLYHDSIPPFTIKAAIKKTKPTQMLTAESAVTKIISKNSCDFDDYANREYTAALEL